MGAEGRWAITMKTPLGSQNAALSLAVDGRILTGRLDSKLGSGEITEGSAEGNAFKWTSEFSLPAPMKAEFTATIDGDNVAGTVILGRHGPAPFTGKRI